MKRSARLSTRVRPALLAIGLALIAASCGERPLSTMDPESPIGRDLDNILVGLLIAAGIVFVLVQGAVIYMAMKFRVKTPDDPDEIYDDEIFPEQVHGNTSLEIGWTIVPTVIMAVVAFFSLGLLFDLEDVSGQDDPGRQIEKVVVVGQQWWWEFQYHLVDNTNGPGTSDGIADIVTSGELVLPIGEEIALDVTSRDVIHSFWVPALNGKRDAVPGRTNTWTIEAGAEGRFPGECTEFCGLSHAYMEKWAVGVSPADFAVWAENQQAPAVAPDADDPDQALAAAGWQVFNNNCASCHVINGLTQLADPPNSEENYAGSTDSAEIYDGANRLIERDILIAGAAPNLTHLASRSTFAGGIFDLYEDNDTVPYMELAEKGDLNRLQLEHWIQNAPELKANAAAELRGMPARALSDDEVDQVVAFLMTLD